MDYEKVAKRIEKDKAMFVGSEIEGKTLGVVGLGAIGGLVVKAALSLGMKVGVTGHQIGGTFGPAFLLCLNVQPCVNNIMIYGMIRYGGAAMPSACLVGIVWSMSEALFFDPRVCCATCQPVECVPHATRHSPPHALQFTYPLGSTFAFVLCAAGDWVRPRAVPGCRLEAAR